MNARRLIYPLFGFCAGIAATFELALSRAFANRLGRRSMPFHLIGRDELRRADFQLLCEGSQNRTNQRSERMGLKLLAYWTEPAVAPLVGKAVNNHFNVSVTDTGIPDHERTRIFEQFHQVDSSLTKVACGTGLGFAIAKQIVEMHGVRILVESTVGKGSTFQWEIPTLTEFRKLTL
jgi:nitrogen-specific signal transduction histidine kinase